MAGFDIYKMDQAWQAAQAEALEKEQAEAAAKAKAPVQAPQKGGSGSGGASSDGSGTDAAGPAASQAAELADNSIGDTSREAVIRQQRAGELEKGKDEAPEYERLTKVPEYQRKAIAMMGNALTMKNVQKAADIGNRERVRKGLSRDPGRQRNTGSQVSTIAIPTSLLRYVQQEIGATQSRLNQNDAMAGFLYWYFGQPDDVMFQDDAQASKIAEVLGNLDANASPSRMGQLNFNISTGLLDKVDLISERLDGISSMLGMVVHDGNNLKMRSDKSYIALCYMLLNYLGMAPLVAPGQRPSDLDFLVGGMAWDMMSGIDGAYDYFKMTDGREKYKARYGIRPGRPSYQPSVPSQAPPVAPPPAYTPPEPEYDDDDDDDDYDPNIDGVDFDDFDDGDDDGYEPVDYGYDLDGPPEDEEGSVGDDKPFDLAAMKRDAARQKAEDERVRKAIEARKARAAAAGSH